MHSFISMEILISLYYYIMAEKKHKFEVKKWNAVATWAWDVKMDTCPICLVNLQMPCIECQASKTSEHQEPCIIAWGVCMHAFHFHCISRWLQTRNTCPLDNLEWEYQKMGQ